MISVDPFTACHLTVLNFGGYSISNLPFRVACLPGILGNQLIGCLAVAAPILRPRAQSNPIPVHGFCLWSTYRCRFVVLRKAGSTDFMATFYLGAADIASLVAPYQTGTGNVGILNGTIRHHTSLCCSIRTVFVFEFVSVYIFGFSIYLDGGNVRPAGSDARTTDRCLLQDILRHISVLVNQSGTAQLRILHGDVRERPVVVLYELICTMLHVLLAAGSRAAGSILCAVQNKRFDLSG